MHYASIDDAAAIIDALRPGIYIAKSHFKTAYRLIPVAISDFKLLGFKFHGKYYFDKMLPFGESISCATREKCATALHWIIQDRSRNPNSMHYLDDSLFLGPPNSDQCQATINVFKQICQVSVSPLLM